MTDSLTREELETYDTIIVAFSGGKDSIACFLHLLDLGISTDKIELWHHDVDGREGSELMDWPVTPSYCRAFAEIFGVPLYFSWKVGGFEREMTREDARTAPTRWENPDGTVGESGGTRGKLGTRRKFPQVSANLSTRWCSAYLKIDICSSAIRGQERFVGKRTLVITGERAEESAARSKYKAFEPDRSDNRDGQRAPRHVDRWRPVHGWSEREVWTIMRRYRVEPHPAYKIGFSRTSCMFCIFGNADQFRTAAEINPAGFERLVRYEADFGVTVKRRVSLPVLVESGLAYEGAQSVHGKTAMAREYFADEIVRRPQHGWRLPAGAFGDSCGPS